MIINTVHKLLTLSVAILVTLTGCGDGVPLAPVSGTVVLDGQPVAKASVMLRPKAGGRPAWANTGEDGSFELTTLQKGDGALIGLHSVTITKFEEQANSAKQSNDAVAEAIATFSQKTISKRWVVPEKYSKQNTSGIEFEVKSGSNTLPIELNSSQ